MAKIFKTSDENMQALDGMKVLLVSEIPGDDRFVHVTLEGMKAQFIAYSSEIVDVD